LITIAAAALLCCSETRVCAADLDRAAVVPANNQSASRIPECGVASVYCALTELDIRVEFDELVKRFERVHGNSDLSSLSIQELIHVLRQYGVNASAVRFDAADIDDVPRPAILYTTPQLRSAILGTGHFAVLVDVQDAYATVIDLTMAGEGRPDGAVHVHKGRLRGIWKGEAILLGTQPFGFSGAFADRNLAVYALVLGTITAAFGMSTLRQISKQVKA
jgi:hypothetical protein